MQVIVVAAAAIWVIPTVLVALGALPAVISRQYRASLTKLIVGDQNI